MSAPNYARRERIASAIGMLAVYANGFCIGQILVQGFGKGNWHTAAISGLVGSVCGVVATIAATFEHSAFTRGLLRRSL